MSAALTGARFLASMLERCGLTHAFVVPTILSETLIAMDEHTGVERVVTHGEKAAAYMADGYARASGRIGFCGAQNVGRANLAAGLQDPYLAGSPVLAVTGGPVPSSLSRRAYQEIDAFGMFAPVTKSSVHVESVDRLPDVLRQALRDATTGQPGPAHVELAGHAGEPIEHASAELDTFVDTRYASVPALRAAPEPGAVAEALRVIESAERPILVAGGGVRASDASAELVALAERLSLPVATSLNGKDTFPGDHPLSVGVVGSYSRTCANRAVSEADLVVYVGSQTSSQVTHGWQVPPASTPVVHVDAEPAELGRHYPRTTPVLGDAKLALQALLGAAGSPADRTSWVARVQTLVAEYVEERRPFMESDESPVRPERLCGDLTRLLPSDALLVADTGHAGMWTGGMVDLCHQGQGYIRAAGSLGWGLPAAIGAQLAVPDRPVVLFTGDGGFWYHVGELETAVRWKVPLVVVVNDNRSLNQEINPYTKAYGGELRGRHHEMWQFDDVDLAAVARSMGASGVRVTRPADFEPAFAKALEADGPTVVDVVTPLDALAPLGYAP
ncbi:MAG: thiamine pyrophosphate-binding protein [Streptosporangiales bacterium]|nr:thiamine pyrophosphate-binding protein [Streptosporangiales bacterium]